MSINVGQAAVMPPLEELDAYLDLSAEEIARLVLCLLIEEALRGRLAVFRHDPPAEPSCPDARVDKLHDL